ncbi:hypothetical protein LLH06_17275 [Mucilaginibacter daejeonensis]|uniref:hypothetical protein n=1 Tax=Mucilaginibacter daejeonensis TaxID=398049 RepID=UPI001D174777|nr:hypothetical protein [Mucilaginibacter daejeonensis]UEG52700.1 hypothetical protein LLH06_17275 [Mucilaginibacter daejeonensis]
MSTIVYGQKLTLKAERKEFLTFYIDHLSRPVHDSLLSILIPHQREPLRYDDAKDFHLSKKDISFMLDQYHANAPIKRLKALPVDKVTKGSQPTEFDHYISLPVFSIKRDVAFIRTYYYCGPLCGSDGIEIYIKRKGKWIPSTYDPPRAEF